MKCRRMIKDDKGQNYVVWFGAKQPKGTTNNNVRALEFEEVSEIGDWEFDIYTQNLSNEVKMDLVEGSGPLTGDVNFWIPLDQTILSESDVTFEVQIDSEFSENVYCGLGNKDLDWVDEENLEQEMTSSLLQTLHQSNVEHDITHLRLQFLDGGYQNLSSSPTITFKISSKSKTQFYNENDKHDNYAEKQEGVATSLTQRLSVIKNELWYNVNEGLPLIDKYRNKNVIDSYVASTILKHPDVINISEFTSSLNKNSYSCKVVVNTIYGNVDLTI